VAVSAKWFGQSFLKAFNKEIDIDSDALKVMLCTSTYTPDQDAHIYKSSVTNEVTGTGYTATGAALTSVVLTYTGATNVIKFDAADVSWPTSTITARYAVVYDSTPATDATRPLICYIDFGADVVSSGGSFDLVFDANGIATVTVA
jgi:hypothetical protein